MEVRPFFLTQEERILDLLENLTRATASNLFSDVVLYTNIQSQIKNLLEFAREEEPGLFLILKTVYNQMEELAFAEDPTDQGPIDLEYQLFELQNILKNGGVHLDESLERPRLGIGELRFVVEDLGDPSFQDLVLDESQKKDVEPLLEEYALMTDIWEELEPDMEKSSLGTSQLRELYRSVHSLKGTSAFFPYFQNTVTQFCHFFEYFLSLCQENSESFTRAQQSGCLLRILIFLRMMMENFMASKEERKRPYPDLNLSMALKQLELLSQGYSCDPNLVLPPDARLLSQEQYVRISVNRIDDLADNLQKILLSLSRAGLENQLSSGLIKEFSLLDKRIRFVQDQVLDMRLFQVSGIFDRIERQVQQLSIDLGKKVNIRFRGRDTRVDKLVRDSVMLPLTHLVNNAIDHGIESPEKRKEMGKPEAGQIMLSADYRGNQIVFEISDDGQGLDPQTLLEKQSPGCSKTNRRPENHELLDWITQPGFSTRETISQVSGRGVGMDVVRTEVENIGGRLELKNQPGLSCTFRLYLPLTYFSSDCLVIQGGGGQFSLLLNQVLLIKKVDDLPPDVMQGLEVGEFRYEKSWLPVISLSGVLGKESSGASQEQLLILEDSRKRRVALEVEKTISRANLLIQPMSNPLLKNIELTRSAGILPDGNLCCILDVDQLVDFANRNSGRQS